LHGGSINVKSEVGFGSTFIVTLPLVTEDTSSTVSAPATGAERDSPLPDIEPIAAGLTDEVSIHPDQETLTEVTVSPPDETPLLLLVDDHADMRAYLRACLAPDYQIIEASDGEEGLSQARHFVPDLVITDVTMPVMDGYAFCREIRSDRVINHVPVIMLTAQASTKSEITGLETGADDYLVKPFHPQALQVRVKNLIERQRQLRERFSKEVLIRPAEITVTSADEAFIQMACEATELHIDDVNFNVDAFAAALGMSLRQLQRKLRALTNLSPKGFIRTIRLERAAQLLKQHYGTVAEVCYAVGFNNPTYFAKCFSEAFGVPPSTYAEAGNL